MLESDGKGGRIPRKPPEWTQYPKGGHRAAPFMLWGGLLAVVGGILALAGSVMPSNLGSLCWGHETQADNGLWTTETICDEGSSGIPEAMILLACVLLATGAVLLVIGVAFLVANIEAAALTVAKLRNPTTDEVRLEGEPTGGASAEATALAASAPDPPPEAVAPAP